MGLMSEDYDEEMAVCVKAALFSRTKILLNGNQGDGGRGEELDRLTY